MSDPYRSADGQPCPRCKAILISGQCPDQCGEWFDNATLDEMFAREELDTPITAGEWWKTETVTPCPACGKRMEQAYHAIGDPAAELGEVIFDRCLAHGIWIDRDRRTDFRAAFAPAIAQRRRIVALRAKVDALVEVLEAGGEAAARALATRLFTLEDTVAQLEERLATLEGRPPPTSER